MHGFHGRYWRFDLGERRGGWVELPPEILRRYVGGVGIGSWILHREAPVGVDPLAPEAPLVFSFSPLVGTPLTTSAKFAVVAKSPLTGMLCDALSGSHFAIEGKRIGADAVVLVGRCDEPSVLVDGALEATELWGCSAAETTAALSARGRVAAIGVAGENLVRFATISNDGRHAGRGGLGAVMGAKRLKALVLRGDVATSVADRERVTRLARSLAARSLGPETAKYRELGTAGNLATMNRVGALPTRNFQAGHFDEAEGLSAESLLEGEGHVRESCANCTIGCEHRYAPALGKAPTSSVAAGETQGVRESATSPGPAATADATIRVEYESLFALGPLCGIAEPAVVLEAARRCDWLGLDTVSTGATIAFAMECRQRSLLEEGPSFGDAASMLAVIDEIGERRGFGASLANGSRALAARLGGEAPNFAPHVKGMELPGYEPRALQTLALGFAVGARGADHNKSSAYELDFSERVDRLHGDARSARLAIEPEDRAALLDSLILCKFLRGVFDDLYAESAEMLEAVTGLDFSAEELCAVAKRVVDLRKAFNEREGWTAADDTLPARFLDEPLPNGAAAGAVITRDRLHSMVASYYRGRGWSAEGRVAASVYRDLAIAGPSAVPAADASVANAAAD